MSETDDKNKYGSHFQIWAHKQGHNNDIMTHFVK